MIRNLDLATLRTLVTVADLAGVTRAANQLHLTQSAVSMQIKRLEELLDINIVERDGRKVRPTPQGEQLISYARKMIALNDEIVDRLTNSENEGSLRFGVPFDIVEPHIPGLLKQFVHQYPRVSVSLSADNTVHLLDQFNAGALDVTLTTEMEPGPGGTVLLERELVWTGAVDGRAWKQEPLPLAFTKTCMFRQPAIRALDDAGIAWTDAIGAGCNYDSGSIACAADLGIRADIAGFRAQGMAPVEDSGERLPPLPTYCVVLYVADGPNSEMAEVFARLIEAAFKATEPEAPRTAA